MSKTKNITLIALMAALICVLAPLSIPIGPVPITLTNLVIYFTAYLLGSTKSTLSCLLYLIIGICGLPVFSGFTGGIGKLAGPTGGYLIGFILLAFICGTITTHFGSTNIKDIIICITVFIFSTALVYLLGTLWFVKLFSSTTTPYTFSAACALCVWPFIPGDIIKIIIACIFGPRLKKRLLPYLNPEVK